MSNPASGPVPGDLRARAQALGQALPPLVVEAERLAASLMIGEHGRRQAGQGEDFWQYRPAMPGDAQRAIDWRRSARGDVPYLRQTEWQSAQAVMLWADPSLSMDFTADAGRPTKADRARLLALALGAALLRGGERAGWLTSGDDTALTPARTGRAHLARLGMAAARGADSDHAHPSAGGLVAHGRAVLLSDFFGPIDPLRVFLAQAADRGVRGALVQVLDPVEEGFPFAGRTLFESMSGAVRHDTMAAEGLAADYRARLDQRRAELGDLARAVGWDLHLHHTDQGAQGALVWLWRVLERRR